MDEGVCSNKCLFTKRGCQAGFVLWVIVYWPLILEIEPPHFQMKIGDLELFGKLPQASQLRSGEYELENKCLGIC